MIDPLNLPAKTKLEWIVWKDACGDSSRVAIDAIKDVRLVTNVNLGWVIHEDAERIVLAHGLSTSGEVDHFAIPVNCVLERRPLFGGKPKRPIAAKKPADKGCDKPTEKATEAAT